MERETGVFEGEKLKDTPDGVGVDSVQLSAQHKRDASARSDLSLLRALSQHFILFSFGE